MAAWKTIDRIGCLLGLLCMLLLGIAVPAGVAAAAGHAAIEPRSQWKYYDGGKDLGEAWRQPAYDDRAWKMGAAPLGYGEPSVATALSFGPNRKNKFVTSYFRTTFAVTDTQAVDRLSLSVLYDDGFVAYLNGTEIARSNIAITRTLSFNLLADKMHAARAFETFARPQAIALLVPGQNVLAIEVHQASKISDKLEFDAALDLGTIADPPAFVAAPALGQLTDTSAHIQLTSDVPTYARVEYGVAPTMDQSVEDATRAITHELMLTGLQPGATYRYRVGIQTASDQPLVWNQVANFTTVPSQLNQIAGHLLAVPHGDWRYDDSGKDPGLDWRRPEYDDSGWKNGPAPLGYGYPEAATALSSGSDSKNRIAAAYFRTTFTVTDTHSIDSLHLNVRYDDGFIAYLNGAEVARGNMPASGALSAQTFASGVHKVREFEAFDLAQALPLLVSGHNLLAVEVHQSSKLSGEMLFDAALAANFVTDPPELVGAPLLGDITGSSVRMHFESDVPTLARVEYGITPQLDQSVDVNLQDHAHDVTLKGLRLGATYRYRVGVRTAADQPLVWSAPFDFTTDGGPGTPFRFGVWAESRPDTGTSQSPVFIKNLHNLLGRRPLALAVGLGDNVALRSLRDGDATVTTTVRGAYQSYTRAVGDLASAVPLYTALGADDNPGCAACLAGYRRSVPAPDPNGKEYYSFDYGDAHFVVANSRQPTGSASAGLSPEQQRWLRDDLAASPRRYKFVFIHDPLFHGTSGDLYSQEQKQALHQLFLATGVTAVFEGGANYYDYSEQDGLPYIIAGGASGAPASNSFNPGWGTNEALIVSVTPSEVGIQAIKSDGGALDRRALHARTPTSPVAQASAAPTAAPSPAAAAAPAGVPGPDAGWLWLGGAALLVLAAAGGGVVAWRRWGWR